MLDQQDIKQLSQLLDERFAQQEEKLIARMDDKLRKTEEKLIGRMDDGLHKTEEKLIGRMDDRLRKTEEKLSGRIDRLEEELHHTKEEVKTLRVIMENDMSRQIKIIAEGHLDLSRKLDEALRIENEREILKIRLVSLESEIRDIKRRLDEIA